jgi:4-carboxymuconolactone decarboxylase
VPQFRSAKDWKKDKIVASLFFCNINKCIFLETIIRRVYMPEQELPKMYTSIKKRYKELGAAVDNLGETIRTLGPIDNKTAHLIQLAAAASIHSEGAVHSHVRRALEVGAKEEEIYHALILLTSTIGFPAVSAAISWADDEIEK